MIQTNKATLMAKISIIFFIIGLISLTTKHFMPEWIDESGLLHEPYFFILPLGFASLFIGLILGAIAFVKSMTGVK